MRDAVVGNRRLDVRVTGGTITQMGPALPDDGLVVQGAGGRLLPGLHDHHIHLLATAAAASSVPCGPESVAGPEGLAAALRGVPGTGWVRGIGYDESVAGPLDRARLDELVPNRPVRVQHRSGALWMINSAGLDLLGPAAPADGLLFRRDAWLRERLGDAALPPLAEWGRRLASYGVTGVTDATPGASETLARAATALPQRVVSLGDPAAGLTTGPRKIVLGDHDLPTYDELAAAIRSARDEERAIAVHSVTRDSLLLLCAVLEEVGSVPGDRVEHAAVAPPQAVAALAGRGMVVVTQPSLIASRGDDYLDRVEPDDIAHLWRHGSLLQAGIVVLCSSDAPYGNPDPWVSVEAATSRRTRCGRVLGIDERVTPEQALAGYLADPLDPPRTRHVEVGAPADLVLLDAAGVRLTMIGGEVAYERDES